MHPALGTLRDFRKFRKEADKRGIELAREQKRVVRHDAAIECDEQGDALGLQTFDRAAAWAVAFGQAIGQVRRRRRAEDRPGVQPPCCCSLQAFIRFSISSGGTSSMWVASVHLWP